MTRERVARRPPARAWASVLALVAIATTTAACGGGTGGAASSTSSSTKAASRQAPAPTTPGSSPATSSTGAASIGTSAPNPATDASFAGQAEAICARRNKELAGVGRLGAHKSQVASVASRRAAIERQALAELTKLTPPATLAHDWQSVIAYSRLTLLQVVRLGEYARSHGTKSVERFRTGSSSGARFRLLVAARHAGLKQCAFVL
jgi:hypothetical protein